MSRTFSKKSTSSSKMSEESNRIEKMFSDIKNKSVFETVVVTDFVSNPEEYLSKKATILDNNLVSNSGGLKNKFNTPGVAGSNLGSSSNITHREHLKYGPNKVLDPSLVDIMPRNSIVGINVTGGKNLTSLDRREIYFPFFAHMSTPIKTGEQVWIFYDNVAGRKVGYWISKKVGSLFVEDLNYTHIDRHVLIEAGLQRNVRDVTAVNGEKINKIGMSFPNPSVSNNGKGTLSTQSYDELILKSYSHSETAKEFVGEAVPRYPKKCSDLVLQGSNNTLIVMTHENELNTGTIKIAAGRKSIPSKLKNIRGTASNFEHEEIDKLTILRGERPDFSEGTIDGQESASLIMTEKFGGMLEFKNSSGSLIKILPNDSGELDANGGIILEAAGGKHIRLGGSDAEESAVLGDTLANILNDLINNLLTISLATAVGPTGPLSASVDGGGAKIAQLLSRIESIKSSTTKVK